MNTIDRDKCKAYGIVALVVNIIVVMISFCATSVLLQPDQDVSTGTVIAYLATSVFLSSGVGNILYSFLSARKDPDASLYYRNGIIQWALGLFARLMFVPLSGYIDYIQLLSYYDNYYYSNELTFNVLTAFSTVLSIYLATVIWSILDSLRIIKRHSGQI